MANLRRDEKGRVTRNHRPWSPENFDDGYANQGRFFVYLPTHPRSDKSGYVLRSIAAWEAYHHQTIPQGMEVHHQDRDSLNDSQANIVILSKEQHLALHRQLRRAAHI